MTDRIQGFIVTLDADVREDDVQPTIDAIMQIKRVVSVQPVVADMETRLARNRVTIEFRRKIYEALDAL
jgi:3'-phosphoadenosine 5'-phosphosulfate sulfotransferase